jgi:hypothetical protein
MSSTTQSHVYESSLPDAINRAFDAAWATLSAHMQYDFDEADELKVKLTQTLISLASDGITDWAELQRRALELMLLNTQLATGSS